MGWGKGGKGFGPGPFGRHHHHRGPGLGVVAAEAAIVGAVAGATVATVAARPPPRPKPCHRGPEVIVIEAERPRVPPPVVVAQAEPVIVVSGTYPKAKAKGKGRWKGKGKGKGPIVVVDNTPPLSISRVSMFLDLAEIRGITHFYAIDVMPESGNPWRVMRSYKQFEELFVRLGRQSFPAASFPRSLDDMASGDGRYDFGFGIGRCSHCKCNCKNRGYKETRTVYCTTCYAERFPDPVVLQTQHVQLEAWLQCVIQHPSSHGPWTPPLRSFLETGREFTADARTPAPVPKPTAKASTAAPTSIAKAFAPVPKQAPPSPVPKQAAYTQSSLTTPAPMPNTSEAPVEQNDEQGEIMSIEIPSGVTAGQIIAITVPNGRQVQFAVPAGQKAGDALTLWYDSAVGTLTPIEDSDEQSESDQTLSIEVPAGVKSGQTIGITVPDGRQIQFVVPEGKEAGHQLDLWFDSAAGTLVPLL